MKTRTNTLFYFFLLPFAFILCSLSFLLVSCNTTEPPPPVNGNGNDKPKPKITLTVDDTSPTEVWLNLITENISLPDTLKLIRNNDTVKTIELFDSSFVIYQDSLLPSQSYSYQVTSIEYQVSSEPVNAVTMDTTSHNFTWEVFEFGEHGNSVLRDVAIIDENNIWAVGAIYLKDSTGANDSKAYGVVHWNGENWTPKKLFYNNNSIISSIRGILILESNDIYLAAGSIFHWNGVSSNAEIVYSRQNLSHPDGTLEKVWGDASSIYAVGNYGSIAHYNGTTWRKIESGTDVDLRDVWGQENIVWVSGYEETGETVLIRIINLTAEIVFSENVRNNPSMFNGTIRSIWSNSNRHLFLLTSTNLYRYSYGIDERIASIKEFGARRAWYERLRGNDVNDLLIGGYKSVVEHYNGKNFYEYIELNDEYKIIFGLEIKERVAVVVGEKYGSGIFSKGYLAIGIK